MEFSQWLKRYWDAHFKANEQYDAIGRRAEEVAPAGTSKKAPMTEGSKKAPSLDASKKATAATSVAPSSASGKTNQGASLSPDDVETFIKLKRVCAELKDTSMKMQEERDFYFGKLRQIEVLSQQEEGSLLDKGALIAKIQDILYAPLTNE